MEDIFEKKIKSFLPYIIIIGVVYLFAPAILVFVGNKEILNQIFYIGLFPLTALACNFFYSYKKEMDFWLSFVAPVFFIPSMFIYGVFQYNWINALIFLVCYFICSYLGLVLGDMFKGKNNKTDENERRTRVPRRVNTSSRKEKTAAELMIEEHDIELPPSFDEEIESGTYDEVETTFDSTADDIDAILAELRDRRD